MSVIDRYLDELFDRLSGTGAVGRRALAEAEDHLRAAADDAVAAGLPFDQAERKAVTRFGPAAMVARRLRSAHRASRLNRALSAAWLVAGLAAAGVGAAYLATAARLDWSAQDYCGMMLTRSCYLLGLPMVRTATCAALAAAVGTVLLLSRWLMVARSGLAPARHGPVTGAVFTIAIAALAAGADGWIPIPGRVLNPLNLTPPLTLPHLTIATALLECLAVTATLASPRPRRHAR